MFVMSLLAKYEKYLRLSGWALGFLQMAEKFAVLFLLLILFDGYKLARYFPELNTFIKIQTCAGPYWINIILMAAEAGMLTLLVSIGSGLVNKKRQVTLVIRLEKAFPELRTKLSTAYDNRQNLNIVTKKLLEEVHKQLAGININKVIPYRQIFRSLTALLLLTGAIFFCINEEFSFDVSPGRLMDEFLENVPDLTGEIMPDEEYENKTSPDLTYNVEAVIIKSGEEVEMEINPGLGLGFTSRTDADTGNYFNGSSENFNDKFRYGRTYTENLPEEYEPMIKQYFEDLSS